MGQHSFKQKAVWDLNEPGVNSQHWCDAMPVRANTVLGIVSSKPSTASGCQPGVTPFKKVCSSEEYHSSCRHLEQASKAISRNLPWNQFPSAAEAWHAVSLQSPATSWRLAQLAPYQTGSSIPRVLTAQIQKTPASVSWTLTG